MNQSLDLQSEGAVAFSEVPKLLPKRNGKRVHYSTIYRWASKGARGRVLESQLVGGVRYTTIAALNRFFETTTIQARNDLESARLREILYGETETSKGSEQTPKEPLR